MNGFMRTVTAAFLLCGGIALAGAQEASGPAEVEQSVTFTVEQAVDYALRNSRTLRSADIDVEIKKRASQNAWNVLLPTVQVSGTLSRQNDISGTLAQMNAMVPLMSAFGAPAEETKETESLHWAAVGSLSISWNLSLAYIQQIRAAKADYESGLISLEQSRRETETSVKKLFYGLLLQQENLRLQRMSLENSRQRSIQARTNFNNGRIPELSYLQASVAYENLRPEVADAERTFKQQLDMFAFLLGLPVGTDITLAGSIEPAYIDLDADDLIARYGDRNLDIRSLQSSLDALNLNRKALDLACYTPALALSWGFQPVLSDAFNKSWTDGDNWTDNGAFSATLAWNLTNLLPFSSNRQQAKDLKANAAKLEIALETLRENQRMTVRKAIDTLANARAQIDAMSRNVDLAQRSYRMAERAFQNGTMELLSLRDTETQLLQAQLGLANQKFNYISALLDLESTLDTDLGE